MQRMPRQKYGSEPTVSGKPNNPHKRTVMSPLSGFFLAFLFSRARRRKISPE